MYDMYDMTSRFLPLEKTVNVLRLTVFLISVPFSVNLQSTRNREVIENESF